MVHVAGQQFHLQVAAAQGQEVGGEFGIELKFKSMEDFRPEAVVEQVEPLRRLLESRTKLADLRNKLIGNEKLEDLLSDVLKNTEQLKALREDSGTDDDQE